MILRIVSLALIVLLAAGCEKTGGSAVQSRLEHAAASGGTAFDFAADPDFVWDQMFVFDCYSSQAKVETDLGFKWPDFTKTGIDSSDGQVLVVFVKSSSVVYWYMQPRSIELGNLDNGTGYPRSAAKFQIMHNAIGRPELNRLPTSNPATTTAG